MMVEKVLR